MRLLSLFVDRSSFYFGQTRVCRPKTSLSEAEESDGSGSKLVRSLQQRLLRIQAGQSGREEIVSRFKTVLNVHYF